MNRLLIVLFLIIENAMSINANATIKTDVCIYGGTSAGVIAAYTAKEMGKSVVLIEPGNHLGGITSSGLGFADIGNKYAISGLGWDFFRRIGKHYNQFEQWIFEPHVAENVFLQYVNEAKVKVLYEHRIVAVNKKDDLIQHITVESSQNPGAVSYLNVFAKEFIDCSYEGDLMAKAGVTYFVGRESNRDFNETYDGVQLMDRHQFVDSIDPYKVKNNPRSGLLWGISNETLLSNGTGDKKVQAYCYRLCLTNNPTNSISITKPENYDSTKYELLLRYVDKIKPTSLQPILKIDLMPNQKTDINNNGPFSTDMIGESYDYPEAGYAQRKLIEKKHKEYTQGLLYFIGHDSRMPAKLRNQMLQWGYPKDEFIDNANWPYSLYIREARRMRGEYVMTQANCEGKEKVTDGIAMAAYTMDSHNCERLVVHGMVKNEGNVEIGGFGPYPISYRSIVPEKNECQNLLVPVCLSATHIAYGSIRMEPVFMVLGQSAAAAAVQAINSKRAIQDIDVRKLQQTLTSNPLANGSLPDILIDDNNKQCVTVKGQWSTRKNGAYGLSMLTAKIDNVDQNESVCFRPQITKSGWYNVYSYVPKLNGLSKVLTFRVENEKGVDTVKIESSNIKIQGQTSGEWVFIGKYPFAKGNNGYVELTAKGASGIIVADAVLLVSVK